MTSEFSLIFRKPHLFGYNSAEPKIKHVPNIIDFLGYIPFDRPDSNDVVEKLRYFKLINGLNFKQLGKLMNSHYEQLIDWLSGRMRSCKRNLKMISKFLEDFMLL